MESHANQTSTFEPGSAFVPTPLDLYALRRAAAEIELPADSLSQLQSPTRAFISAIRQTDEIRRAEMVGLFCNVWDDPEATRKALEGIDPLGPPPDIAIRTVGPRLLPLKDVIEREIEWLWTARIPNRKLSLLAGDPKLGKSLVAIQIAARITRGCGMPDDPHTPGISGSVLYLNAEDDPADTIRPRFRAAGADLGRVFIIDAIVRENGTETTLPNLAKDIAALEQAATSIPDCRLIIIDPISAYLGGTDDHKNSELRSVLAPLKGLAERNSLAVILVTHLNKSGGANAKHRVTGSIAYVGAVRSYFMFAADPDDPKRRLMCCGGSNLAEEAPTMAYRIITWEGIPCVQWDDGPVDITADQLLQDSTSKPDAREEGTAAERWLKEALQEGDQLARDILRMGKLAAFSESTIRRAKSKVPVYTYRSGFGRGSECYWTLRPGPSTRSAPQPAPPADDPTPIGCHRQSYTVIESSEEGLAAYNDAHTEPPLTERRLWQPMTAYDSLCDADAEVEPADDTPQASQEEGRELA